jgi:hypothetical protein
VGDIMHEQIKYRKHVIAMGQRSVEYIALKNSLLNTNRGTNQGRNINQAELIGLKIEDILLD